MKYQNLYMTFFYMLLGFSIGGLVVYTYFPRSEALPFDYSGTSGIVSGEYENEHFSYIEIHTATLTNCTIDHGFITISELYNCTLNDCIVVFSNLTGCEGEFTEWK